MKFLFEKNFWKIFDKRLQIYEKNQLCILMTTIIILSLLSQVITEKVDSEFNSNDQSKISTNSNSEFESENLFSSLEKLEKFKSESINYKSNFRNQILLSKCATGLIADKALCENLNNLSNKYGAKTIYRVEAVLVDSIKNETNTKAKSGKSEIFKLAIPINTCKNEDCEFCCLSNNRCGTFKQCSNSKYYRKFLNGIFFFLIGLFTLVFIIKCFQIDSYPDQDKDDKLKTEQLSDMISLYAITRNNRNKFLK